MTMIEVLLVNGWLFTYDTAGWRNYDGSPTCSKCGRVMVETGSGRYGCWHDQNPPPYPDLPREREHDVCGERHVIPGACPQPHDPNVRPGRKHMTSPFQPDGGLVPLPPRPLGAMTKPRRKR